MRNDVKIAGLLSLLCLCVGCAHHPRVQNPFPGVFRVAVVPFGDKTTGAEGLDTLRVTNQFVSELQKVPTYEVVPLEEVIDVLGSNHVETNQPALAFAVARAVHAQAVIVGDVTEYNAYYPPVLGLHCEMYAMVTGEPAVEVEPISASAGAPGLGLPLAGLFQKFLNKGKCADGTAGCGPGASDKLSTGKLNDSDQRGGPDSSDRARQVKQVAYTGAEQEKQPAATTASTAAAGPAVVVSTPIVEPWVIRHSRVFDGGNAGFVRKLQDYYFFRNDMRGGEWMGYLDRMDDFTRFSCNRMVYEMLQAAGGEWTPLVGVEFPMPWEPWPWR